MGQTIIGTTDTYTQLICNHSSELIGSYPNITFRIHYNFQVRITTSGSWYWNGFRLWFHNNSHSVNLAMNGGTTGVLASGYIDLGIYGLSTTHVPGFGCSGPFSASGTISETQTIATGSMTANLVSYGHDSAIINIALNSPRNYWYARIYNATDKTWAISEAKNGQNTISGLTPGKNYTFHVEMWRRDGSSFSSQKKISFMTTGFSYLDGDVSNTIGNAITFPIRTYNDEFTTKVKITCDNITLQEVDVNSSDLVYEYSYIPSKKQLTSIYNLIPNSLSTTGTVILTTYVDGSSIGSESYTITFNVDQNADVPIITSYDYVDTVQKALDKTGNNKWVLQNVSKLRIQNIIAGAKNGASIAEYRVTIGNNTVNSTTTSILVDNVVESDSGIYLTVIDSRGLQTIKFLAFTRYIPYTKLYFTEVALARVNDVEEQTTLSMKGWFDRLKIDNVDKNTAINFQYRYRASDSSNWSAYTSKTVTLNGNEFSYSNVIGNFDVGVSYIFELVVSDYFFSSESLNNLLMKGAFEFFIGDGFVEVNGEFNVENASVKGALGFIRALGASENLNNCTIEGYYHQRLNANASIKNNYPVAEAGLLIVVKRDYIYQTYQTYNNSGFYYRSFYNSWSSWKKVSTEGHLHDDKYLKSTGGTLTGDLTLPSIYADNWFRSTGKTGWLNETYGGGFYMEDNERIKTYNNKNVQANCFISTDKGARCCTGYSADHFTDKSTYMEVIGPSSGAKGITWWASDKSLKDHIRSTRVNEALNKISQLKHVEFDFKENNDHVDLGYIADDVEQVLSCLTFDVEQYDENNKPNGKYLKHINHTTMIPLITMGMQELIYENELLWTFNNQVVDEFEKRDALIADLTARLEKLENGN